MGLVINTTGEIKIFAQLTQREEEILTMIVRGMTYPEIARKLDRSLRTIDSMALNMRKRVNAKNKAQMVVYFYESEHMRKYRE